MGAFPAPYTDQELAALSDKQRQILRDAVLKELQSSKEISAILRRKTLNKFKDLTKKK